MVEQGPNVKKKLNIYYVSAVGQLGPVGIRPYYQAEGRTLLIKTLDWPTGPIVAARGQQGCKL